MLNVLLNEYEWMNEWINEWINQSINQSMKIDFRRVVYSVPQTFYSWNEVEGDLLLRYWKGKG